MSTISFNCIYVIQSLPNNETQTGTNLHDDIIKRRTYNIEHLSSTQLNIETKEEFLKNLIILEKDFLQKGIVPYLHFEIHGCKKGLVLKNKELVIWEEMEPLFVRINSKIKNNLFVSLATCFGSYIFNAVSVISRSPFFAFIGPFMEIKEEAIIADWESYFDTLLFTKDFDKVIDALNNSNFHERSPYTFYTSEKIFDTVSKGYLKMYSERSAKRENLKKRIKEAKKDSEIKRKFSDTQLKDFLKASISNQPRHIEQLRNYFLFKTDVPFIL